MANILALDIGTTTIIGLLYDTKTNKIIGIKEIYHNGFVKNADLLKSEINPSVLCKELFNVLNSFNKYSIDGISLTGQMHGFIALDKYYKPVTNFITWMDKRALHQNSTGKTYLEEFLQLLNFKPKNSMIGYMASNLYAMKQSGSLPREAQHFVTIHDFVSNELCGRALIDPSFAESTGFFDSYNVKWNNELINKCGFSPDQFSEIQDTSTFIGNHKDIPVFVGLGDNQASVLGSIEKIDEMLLINIGTGGQVSLVLKKGENISPEIETRMFVEEMRLAIGAALCSGKSYEIIMRFIKDIGSIYFNTFLNDKDVYSLMEKNNNINTSMLCEPTFLGTREDPNRTGKFYNINLNNFTISDFLGALSNGIIEELYNLYKKINVERKSIIASGGLVKKSLKIQKVIQKIFSKELLLTGCDQEAAMGAVISAAKGLKIINSFEDIRKFIKYHATN
jgi:sedoheptulokinase